MVDVGHGWRPFTLPSPAPSRWRPAAHDPGSTKGGHRLWRQADPPQSRTCDWTPDDRIGLLGVNGAGKSTFAKMAAGALPIASGHMHRDRRIQVGWFHQHQIEALDPNDTPLAIIRREMKAASESGRRARLAQFGWASTSRRPRWPTCPAASARACC